MTSILLIEDNEDLTELIRFHLEKDGYTVTSINSGIAAMKKLKNDSFNLVILDLMIPEISGLELLSYMKNSPNLKYTPVIIESAKCDDADVIKGLEMGAEDYVTKPFSPKVLLARVRRILSRNMLNNLVWKNPKLLIDKESREVYVEDQLITVTQIEFDILQFLAENAGRVVSRSQIVTGAWKDDVEIIDRAVDVHLTQLRKKLSNASSLICTVRGVGYKMKLP
ncbi:MAG: response regulator transcription factor [Caldisericia bacterium]|nr:response regulator transcription factor [Caldisericia bacterium]